MAGGDTFGKSATQTFLNFQKKGMTGRLTSEAQLTKGALLFAPDAGKDGIFGTKDDGNGHLEAYAGNGMSVGNDGRPGQKGNTLKYHKLNLKRFSAYANIDPATTQASEYMPASNNTGSTSRTEVHHSYDFKFSSDGALTADQIQQVIRVLKPAAAPKVEPRRQAGINRGKA